MTKTEEWAFDGQLDATETPTTSPAEERAKIAALFGKSAPEQKASEPIDYAAAFAAHKGKQAPEPKDQEQVKREQETPSQTDSEDDITASYKAHLTQLLSGHQLELENYQEQLEQVQQQVSQKETTVKTIKAILMAIDSLN